MPEHKAPGNSQGGTTKPHFDMGAIEVASAIRTRTVGGRGSSVTPDHVDELIRVAREFAKKGGYPMLPLKDFCAAMGWNMPKNVNNFKARVQRDLDKMPRGDDCVQLSYTGADNKNDFAPTPKTAIRWGIVSHKKRMSDKASRAARNAEGDEAPENGSQ